MAAYNKELRDSTGTNTIYPLTKAQNVYLNDGTTVEASLPVVNVNGVKIKTTSFYAPTSAGTNGYVLKSNGSGEPTWAEMSSGPDIVVSSSQPSNQKSGDFWYQIV